MSPDCTKVVASIVVACAACAASSRPGDGTLDTFDIAQGFSASENPNGPWSYGYIVDATVDGSAALATFPPHVHAVDFWHASATVYYPYAAHAEGSSTTLGSMNGWAVRPGEVAMEGSGAGQASVVRFAAPHDGVFTVIADFAGIHFGLSSTDVHVL